MQTFFSYVILGLSLSIPIGPINAAQLDKGIHQGFFHSWLVGVGGMFADVIFMLLIYFGVAPFLTTPFVKTFLWVFGCFILLYIGIESLTKAKSTLSNTSNVESTSKFNSFGTGFIIAISNPISIIFWLGIYGSVLAKTTETSTNSQLLIYSSGIFLGIILWDIFMASVATSFRKFFHSKALYWISIIAGIVLIGFGIFFGYEAFRAIQYILF
ncbi:amino acid transporter [Oceanobacillus sp. E9]|uniref:Amino acid efflux protein YcgF n=1 Tax=Oceanobacillus kimchii TaxID=746691 RepID=A0ABQ5TPY7_9BACI|nr:MULTISPECIES: LysE family translocator [Oceanobacillus]OEH56209.1 amino acid transporter [Oceanobacillus sp. E9]GLO67889.1 putative amino acid efflux protein YcgF [Oceanobacillus kimchii]